MPFACTLLNVVLEALASIPEEPEIHFLFGDNLRYMFKFEALRMLLVSFFRGLIQKNYLDKVRRSPNGGTIKVASVAISSAFQMSKMICTNQLMFVDIIE